jgi:hypothetical protein
MPRLRYKKSYDFTLYEQEDETSDRQDNAGGEEEESTGRSWLSNAVIASQLSEAKIKKAISALKAQITVLEAELLSRRLGNSHNSYKNWDEIGDSHRRKNEEQLWDSKPRRRRNSTVYQFQKVASLRKTLTKLGVKDVDKLIAEWSKLNERKSDEK